MFTLLQESVNTGIIDVAGWIVALGGLAFVGGWYYKLVN